MTRHSFKPMRTGKPFFILCIALALLLLPFFLPWVNSTTAPYFPLNTTSAELAYWISFSGSKWGIPLLMLIALGWFISRSGISRKQRIGEFTVIALTLAVFAGGGSYLNEHLLKPVMKKPRPNLLYLAGENGSGPLGMTVETFYASGNKEQRRIPLAAGVRALPASAGLNETIKQHWIEESGYSFPSGHAFAAFFVATFFLLLAHYYRSGRHLAALYLLLPWAILVAYSRSLLRVHTPTDILVGALLGVTSGIVAVWVCRRLLSSIGFENEP